MSDPVDRRTILASTLAWAALTLSGCSDGHGSGGTGGAGGRGGTGGTGGSSGTGGAGGICVPGTGGMSDAGGTGGTGPDGAADDGGATYMCMHTMTGTHVHPLTIPGSDVEHGSQDAPYILEDGGTCHTHTLQLSGYDFGYLQAGATIMVDSSTTANHLHTVSITCTPS